LRCRRRRRDRARAPSGSRRGRRRSASPPPPGRRDGARPGAGWDQAERPVEVPGARLAQHQARRAAQQVALGELGVALEQRRQRVKGAGGSSRRAWPGRRRAPPRGRGGLAAASGLAATATNGVMAARCRGWGLTAGL
jgi:hypothetical protein